MILIENWRTRVCWFLHIRSFRNLLPVFADWLLMSFSKDCCFSEEKIAMVEDVEWPVDYSQ